MPRVRTRLPERIQFDRLAQTARERIGADPMRGGALFVLANYGAEFIVSDLYKRGTVPITQNGRYYAVQVGDLVFDNLNKGGVLRETWEKALHSPFGHTIESVPF